MNESHARCERKSRVVKEVTRYMTSLRCVTSQNHAIGKPSRVQRKPFSCFHGCGASACCIFIVQNCCIFGCMNDDNEDREIPAWTFVSFPKISRMTNRVSAILARSAAIF